MAKHIPGDKVQADLAEERATAQDVLASAPIVDDPTGMGTKDDWRRAYADGVRGAILSYDGPQRAEGGFGFYGDYTGHDLYAPPVEFAGFGADSAHFSPTDAYSHPARFGGYGGGYGGYQTEGWMYNRGGHTNIDHQRIAQCVLLYKTEGIVQTVVNLLADFAVENVDLIHEDATVHNFYQAWKIKVGLKERLHRFVVDLLQTGNVFIWTKEAKLKDAEKTAMKRGRGAQLIGNELVVQLGNKQLRDKTITVEMDNDQFTRLKELSAACHAEATAGKVNEVMLEKVQGGTRNDPTDPDAADKQDKKRGLIPWDYVSLNPLQMEPRGSRFANEHYWVMMLSRRDMKPLSRFMSYRYYSDISTTKVNLPEIFQGKLKATKPGSAYAAELRLDEERLAVIQDVTKADYEDWATPQIYPAHKEVAFKRMMRQAEISATESLKHAITLIKLGNIEEGFIPTPEQIERVAAALAGGSQVHHLVWDDLIKGEVLQPDIGKIMDPKKYVQVDKDIYAALGISESVMSGNGSFANSFLSIKLLLEKLETIRCKLESWLRVEVKKISDAMKFRRLPIIKWGLMNLRDENTERKLWIELYDRGIVSDESILERFGTDFDIEAERQKYEKKVKEEENKGVKKDDETFRSPVMVSQGPFKRDVLSPPKPKPVGGGKGGRPVKTGKPQTKKRNTKPKGMGAIIKFQKYHDFATSALKVVTKVATQLAVKNQDVKDSRSLTKAQKAELDQIISYVLAALNPDVDLSEDLVYNILTGDDAIFSTEKNLLEDLDEEASRDIGEGEELPRSDN
jgi:hypothetical protein